MGACSRLPWPWIGTCDRTRGRRAPDGVRGPERRVHHLRDSNPRRPTTAAHSNPYYPFRQFAQAVFEVVRGSCSTHFLCVIFLYITFLGLCLAENVRQHFIILVLFNFIDAG